jgi:hypothetical protein
MKTAPRTLPASLIFLMARLPRPLGFIGHHILGILHYAYLIRVSLMGIAVLLALPLLAAGPLRTLALGAYDVRSFAGALLIGFSLVVTAGCLVHQRKLVDLHGVERFGAPLSLLKSGMTRAWSWLLGAAIALNGVVVLRASEPGLFWHLLFGLVGGMLLAQVLRRTLHGLETRLADARHGPPRRLVAFLVSNGLQPSPGFIEPRRRDAGFTPDNVTLCDGHLSAFVYGSLLLAIFILVEDHSIHPLASLLLLVCVLTLIISMLAFLLDRHRVPVMAGIAAYCLFMNLWRESDHYYPVLPRPASAQPLPIPAAIVQRSVEAGLPLVVVSAAGGGIQSAAWTTRVLAELERQMAAVGSPGFHRSVRLISGVSGGSVGALQYAHAIGLDEGTPPLDEAAAAAGSSSLWAAVLGMVKKDLVRATLPMLFTTEQKLFQDRGRMLELAWCENAAGRHRRGRLESATLQQWGLEAADLKRPALVFNATVVETGERMAISTAPRRPLGYYSSETQSIRAQDRVGGFEFTERYLADIPMVTAARLSATFPLISPAARPAISPEPGRGLILPGAEHERVFPRGGSLHHVVDGGYFENSGLVGALEWLDEALTDLKKAGRRLPEEVLVIELAAFPDPPEDLLRQRSLDLGRKSQGSLFDLISPAVTMAGVRNSSQSAFASQLLLQFSRRWQLELDPGKPADRRFIRHVKIRPSAPETATSEASPGLLHSLREWFFIKASLNHAPLSWHLRTGEVAQINKAAEEAVKSMLADEEQMLPQVLADTAAIPLPKPKPAPSAAAAAAPDTVPRKNGRASRNSELFRRFIVPGRNRTPPPQKDP